MTPPLQANYIISSLRDELQAGLPKISNLMYIEQKKTIKNQQGFTLIELVLIVLIIGILAAVAIPKYAGMREEATDGVAKGVLGTLRSTNAMLYARNLAGNTTTPYTAGDVTLGVDVQGDINTLNADSTTQISVVISGKTYTFGFSQPFMPTTMGIVSAGTTGW